MYIYIYIYTYIYIHIFIQIKSVLVMISLEAGLPEQTNARLRLQEFYNELNLTRSELESLSTREQVPTQPTRWPLASTAGSQSGQDPVLQYPPDPSFQVMGHRDTSLIRNCPPLGP